MIKVGDIVKIMDHSWVMALLLNGSVEQERGVVGGNYREDKLIVKAVDCILPTSRGSATSLHPPNDVLLWNETKGCYVCIRSDFLKVIGKICPHGGYLFT